MHTDTAPECVEVTIDKAEQKIYAKGIEGFASEKCSGGPDACQPDILRMRGTSWVNQASPSRQLDVFKTV